MRPPSCVWLCSECYWSVIARTFCISCIVLSHWDFSHGKFGLLSLGKASCDIVALRSLRCMLSIFSVSTIHRTLAWTTGSLTCAQMLIIAIAHGGVQTYLRESALKVDCGRKIPCCTGESNLVSECHCIGCKKTWCNSKVSEHWVSQ